MFQQIFIRTLTHTHTQTVSLEMNSDYFTGRCYKEAMQALCVVTKAVVDDERLVNWIRVVKSPAEIEQVHHGLCVCVCVCAVVVSISARVCLHGGQLVNYPGPKGACSQSYPHTHTAHNTKRTVLHV